MLVFLGKKGRKPLQTVKNYGGSKNTTDSGAVVFLVRVGPLGFGGFDTAFLGWLSTSGYHLKTPHRNSGTACVSQCVQKTLACRGLLGSAFGRTGFSRFFEPPDFFAGFVAGFFLIFVGKSAQKNPPGKSPTKSSKIYTTKIPDNFLQRGQAKFRVVDRGPSIRG